VRHSPEASRLSIDQENKAARNEFPASRFIGVYQPAPRRPPKSPNPTTHPKFVPMEFSSTNLV
jgi:hypothetical protein